MRSWRLLLLDSTIPNSCNNRSKRGGMISRNFVQGRNGIRRIRKMDMFRSNAILLEDPNVCLRYFTAASAGLSTIGTASQAKEKEQSQRQSLARDLDNFSEWSIQRCRDFLNELESPKRQAPPTADDEHLSYFLRPDSPAYKWLPTYFLLDEEEQLISWLSKQTNSDETMDGNRCAFSPILDACADTSVRSKVVLCILRNMINNGKRPGSKGFLSGLNACRIEGEVEAIDLLVQEMENMVPPHPGIMKQWEFGHPSFGWEEPNTEHYNSAMSAAAMQGNSTKVHQLLKRARKRGLHDTDSYNYLIESYGRSMKSLDASFVLLSTLEANDLMPTSLSYENVVRSNTNTSEGNAISSELSNKSSSNQTLKNSSIYFLEDAKSKGVVLDSNFYIVAMHGFMAQQNLKGANQLLESILLNDIEWKLDDENCDELLSIYMELIRVSTDSTATKCLAEFIRRCDLAMKNKNRTIEERQNALTLLAYFKKYGLYPP